MYNGVSPLRMLAVLGPQRPILLNLVAGHCHIEVDPSIHATRPLGDPVPHRGQLSLLNELRSYLRGEDLEGGLSKDYRDAVVALFNEVVGRIKKVLVQRGMIEEQQQRHQSLTFRPTRVHGVGEAHRLFDHLIRPLQERRRDRQAEGLGGLEVDD